MLKPGKTVRSTSCCSLRICVQATTEEPPCRAARHDRIAHIPASAAMPSAKLSLQESPTSTNSPPSSACPSPSATTTPTNSACSRSRGAKQGANDSGCERKHRGKDHLRQRPSEILADRTRGGTDDDRDEGDHKQSADAQECTRLHSVFVALLGSTDSNVTPAPRRAVVRPRRLGIRSLVICRGILLIIHHRDHHLTASDQAAGPAAEAQARRLSPVIRSNPPGRRSHATSRLTASCRGGVVVIHLGPWASPLSLVITSL